MTLPEVVSAWVIRVGVKYSSPEDLRAEKAREDRLREVGYEVVRLTWADLDHPERVRAKILAAFARSAVRSA